MRTRTPLAVLVTLGLAFAACGDDAEELSKDDFIEQADELCADAQDEIDDLGDPESEDPEDVAAFLEDGKEIYEGLAEDLDGLAPPGDDADEVDEVFGKLDELIEKLDDAIAAAEDDDEEAMGEAFEDLDEISNEAEELASDYGFEECGIDTSSDESDDESTDEEESDDEATDEEETDDTTDDESAAGDVPDARYSPTQEDIDALVPVFSEGAGGLFTDEESECMVTFLLERYTLAEFQGLSDAASEAAAMECLSTSRLIEIGLEASE